MAKLQLEVKCQFPTEWRILSSLNMTFNFLPQIITRKIDSIQIGISSDLFEVKQLRTPFYGAFRWHPVPSAFGDRPERGFVSRWRILGGCLGTEDLITLKRSANKCSHNMCLLSLLPSSLNSNLNDSCKELWLLI